VKGAIAATVTLVAGLFLANMLGVAVAEAPTTTTTTTTTSTPAPAPAPPLRTVSVTGVATKPIGQFDSAAEATAVYREAMAEAVNDGQSKASFLAGKIGATLGAVQSATEGGGSIDCTGGEESNYAEYQGEQPDFASGPRTVAAPVAAEKAAARKVTHTVKKRKRKHPTAKKAAAVSCKLSAQVPLIYAIS
jgi:Protein of unknown function (DUF541)